MPSAQVPPALADQSRIAQPIFGRCELAVVEQQQPDPIAGGVFRGGVDLLLRFGGDRVEHALGRPNLRAGVEADRFAVVVDDLVEIGVSESTSPFSWPWKWSTRAFHNVGRQANGWNSIAICRRVGWLIVFGARS